MPIFRSLVIAGPPGHGFLNLDLTARTKAGENGWVGGLGNVMFTTPPRQHHLSNGSILALLTDIGVESIKFIA